MSNARHLSALHICTSCFCPLIDRAEFQRRSYRKPKIPSSYINVHLYPYRPTAFINSFRFSAICWLALASKNNKKPLQITV